MHFFRALKKWTDGLHVVNLDKGTPRVLNQSMDGREL